MALGRREDLGQTVEAIQALSFHLHLYPVILASGLSNARTITGPCVLYNIDLLKCSLPDAIN